jgi:hypothetical protein
VTGNETVEREETLAHHAPPVTPRMMTQHRYAHFSDPKRPPADDICSAKPNGMLYDEELTETRNEVTMKVESQDAVLELPE